MRTTPVATLLLRLGTILGAVAVGIALFVDLPDVAIGGASLDPLLFAVWILLALLWLVAVVERSSLRAWVEALATDGGQAERTERRVLWILVLAGFALRVAGFHQFGLNPDEAQFVWFGAADTLAEVLRYELVSSPHPPANFFLMHGILEHTWSLFWLRLPAVLAGTYLIWISHRFTRPLFGPVAALAVAFLVAFSPGLVDLSRVCRNYAPGFAVLVTGLAFLAAYLRSDRWRDYAVYACLAPLAALWHYGFVTVFVGVDLALGILLLVRRRSLAVWLRVIGGQLPLAAVLLWLYVAHISGIERIVEHHYRAYSGLLDIAPGTLLEPIAGVWRYLMREPAATLLLVLAGIGLVDLARRRRGTELLVCTLPPIVAYGLAVTGKMPLGATRHSAYLFPFFFALAASQIPRLLAGYGRQRWRLPGAVVVLATAVIVVNGSMIFYTSDVGWSPLDPQNQGRELMKSYRQVDVERAYALLEERFEPGDVVMLGPQSLMALRIRLELSPLLDPTPEQIRQGDLRIPLPTLHREHGGVHYYASRAMSVAPTPERLLASVRHVRNHFQLPKPQRVWMIRGAWEAPMATYFDLSHPDLPYDREIDATSNGMLFVIDFDELLKVGAGARR